MKQHEISWQCLFFDHWKGDRTLFVFEAKLKLMSYQMSTGLVNLWNGSLLRMMVPKISQDHPVLIKICKKYKHKTFILAKQKKNSSKSRNIGVSQISRILFCLGHPNMTRQSPFTTQDRGTEGPFTYKAKKTVATRCQTPSHNGTVIDFLEVMHHLLNLLTQFKFGSLGCKRDPRQKLNQISTPAGASTASATAAKRRHLPEIEKLQIKGSEIHTPLKTNMDAQNEGNMDPFKIWPF